jgi:hypothetical protein
MALPPSDAVCLLTSFAEAVLQAIDGVGHSQPQRLPA